MAPINRRPMSEKFAVPEEGVVKRGPGNYMNPRAAPPPPTPVKPRISQPPAAPAREMSQCDKVNHLAQALATFYVSLFPSWKFPPHMFPVAKALCDDRIDKLMLTVGPGAGKSQLISVVYPAFKLGMDPGMTILGISGAEGLVQGFMQACMEFVEYSPAYREFFPSVRPDKSGGWSKDSGMYVTGRNKGLPDASYFAAGLSSASLVGKHARTLILDDLHNKENSATSAQCAKVVQAYYNTLLGRADPAGARFIIAGRRWREDDLYGVLQESGAWVTLRLPAERPGSRALWHDVIVPEDVECVFTEELTPVKTEVKNGVTLRHYRAMYGIDPKEQGFFWPASPAKRKEYFEIKRGSPADAESVYQCNPGSREGPVFSDNDFVYYDAPDGLEWGFASSDVQAFCESGQIIQGWDTAYSASSDADYSVCVTALLVPCDQYHRGEDVALMGECDIHYDIYILDVWRDRLDFADLFPQSRELAKKWRPSQIVIEKKASGIPLIDTLSRTGLPVEGVRADIGKRARAISGIGAGSTQGWFRLGRIKFPVSAPWLKDLVQELKDFTGDDSGKDDQVDAMVHTVNHAIQMGGATPMIPTSAMTQNVVANIPGNLYGMPQEDPFDGMCGRCISYREPGFCVKHNKKTFAMGTCPDFDSESGLKFIL